MAHKTKRRQGTSLRLATCPWPETTGKYCGLQHPGQARGLGRCESPVRPASVLLILLCALLSARPANDHRRWVFTMEQTIVQSPAVGSDGTIYIGTGVHWTGPASDSMYAIRPDGTLKWKRHLGRAVHSSVALDREDNLYFIAGNADTPDRMDAVLVSLDSSGNPRWMSEAIGWQYPVPLTGFTPAIASDGAVYASGRYSLYAFDRNGTRKWRFDFPLWDNQMESGTETTGSQRSAPTIGADGTIYVNTQAGSHEQETVEGGVFAFRPDGTLKWRTHDIGGTAAPVIGADGTIYSAVGCYWVPGATDAADVAKESKLLAINPDGMLKWSVTTQLWIQASPSIGPDGTLYAGTTHHPLDIPAWFYAISPEGQIKWKYDTYDDVKDLPPAQINPPDIYNSPAVDSNGIVYFGNEIGLLYALSPDGKVAWMDNDIWSLHDQGPALADDGTLYVATHSDLGLIAMNTGSRGLADSPWPKFRRNNANTGNAATPRQYSLTIAARPGGTTNPAPGTYTYDEGTSVRITATANAGSLFGGWSGDASGTTNPVTITINGNKTVTANFINVEKPPLNLTGVKLSNRSVSMVEYVARLRWQANTANTGTITYRIYQIVNGQATKIADAGAGIYEYLVRNLQQKQTYQFGVTAVNSQGWESDMVEVTVQ
jgi:outer membrane protein assembly factor BamB